MKRVLVLTKRNLLETLRDPLSLVFCLIFPLFMLVLMEIIYNSMGAEMQEGASMFKIENFAAGIAVFGYTFTMLFITLGICGDKNSAFMTRLLISPIKPFEYYLSYIFSSFPICLAQTVIFYAVSLFFGLKINLALLISIIYLIPSMLLYISCGLFIGAVAKTDKQSGPLCSLFITGAGLLGGVWFPLDSIDGAFKTICNILPFLNSIKPSSFALIGDYTKVFPYMIITLSYTVVLFTVSALLYKIKTKNH